MHNIPDDLEIETFVHGAMCISYSGRCLLSNYLYRQGCKPGSLYPSVPLEICGRGREHVRVNICRFMKMKEERIFSIPRTLCMIEHIPELIDAGIDSFKIEGRMKTALYVATVARTYRKAIDDYRKDPELYRKNMPWYLDQISNCTYRQFTTGFFFGKPSEEKHRFTTATPISGSTHILESTEEIKDGMVTHRTEK